MLVYIRYHDDCFVIFESRSAAHDFWQYLKSILSYFNMKVRKISKSEVDFLDLSVYLVGGHLSCMPSLAKEPRPLCVHSAHPKRVHMSWPRSVANRALTLGGVAAHEKLVANYVAANTHPSTIALLKHGRHSTKSTNASCPRTRPLITFVCRYHPVFEKAVSLTMRQVPVPLSLGFDIRASFANRLPSVQGVLESVCDTMGRGVLLWDHKEEGVSLYCAARSHMFEMRIGAGASLDGEFG